MPSCPTVSRAAWSRRTARSSGCACPAPTRRACSGRCWTGLRGTSGSVRPAPRRRISADTSRAPCFSGEEGTFTICSFWLVSALALIGETDRARALCQKLLSFAGPLLLYAEEIDPTNGEHLGNFPQAFTHLALIEAVSLLIASELAEDVKSAGWDPAAGTQVRSG